VTIKGLVKASQYNGMEAVILAQHEGPVGTEAYSVEIVGLEELHTIMRVNLVEQEAGGVGVNEIGAPTAGVKEAAAEEGLAEGCTEEVEVLVSPTSVVAVEGFSPDPAKKTSDSPKTSGAGGEGGGGGEGGDEGWDDACGPSAPADSHLVSNVHSSSPSPEQHTLDRSECARSQSGGIGDRAGDRRSAWEQACEVSLVRKARVDVQNDHEAREGRSGWFC
jgi:hypothetical protein